MTQAVEEEWTGRGVTIAQIERQLGSLREQTYEATKGPDLRTNVLTHLAWVPERWRSAAEEVLAGLAERHPSRTIVLAPDPTGDDGLNAELSVRCFPLPGEQRNVCSETIELGLGGGRASAPASIVEPLLIPDLPVFLRWRGEPSFGAREWAQLVEVADRLVVDSAEWDELPAAYGRLAEVFERIAVSDIAWGRSLEWRRALAARWPGIVEIQTLSVAGPAADAHLLAGWLRSRLRRQVDLEQERADCLERIEVDGEPVAEPVVEPRSPADVLSDELENFGRNPVYEQAVLAAVVRD